MPSTTNYERATRTDSSSSIAYFNLADKRSQQHKREADAIACVSKSIQLDRVDSEGYLVLSQMMNHWHIGGDRAFIQNQRRASVLSGVPMSEIRSGPSEISSSTTHHGSIHQDPDEDDEENEEADEE